MFIRSISRVFFPSYVSSRVHLPQIRLQQGFVRGRHPKELDDDPTANLLDILYGLTCCYSQCSPDAAGQDYSPKAASSGSATRERDRLSTSTSANKPTWQGFWRAHNWSAEEELAWTRLYKSYLNINYRCLSAPGMLRVTWREGTNGAVTTRSTSRVRRLSSSAIMASLHSVNATVRAIVVAFTRPRGGQKLCCRRCPLNDREANGQCRPRLSLWKIFYNTLCNYTKFMLRRESRIDTKSSKE